MRESFATKKEKSGSANMTVCYSGFALLLGSRLWLGLSLAVWSFHALPVCVYPLQKLRLPTTMQTYTG